MKMDEMNQDPPEVSLYHILDKHPLIPGFQGDPSSTDGTKTFPNAMLLRLFGLDGEPLESELVPFAQSYEVDWIKNSSHSG